MQEQQTRGVVWATGITWRSIGPYRGGRSVAVVGHPTDRQRFYMGTTGGGVWRTDNGGVTWANITDGFFRSASVGALALAPSDPNVLVAGMGEACIRGNVSFGDGVYRSTDQGATWSHLGLADTRHISRIRIDPTNPDRLYVGALGHAFGPHEARGVYVSDNGGRTFDRTLYVSDGTGVADLALDPNNPRVLYAVMWQTRRTPWSLESGGPESGLYRSTDCGRTWESLKDAEGLPGGIWGRAGVAVSPADSQRLWLVVEAEERGLYRSDDGGRRWARVSVDHGLLARPFYYSHVFADPVDPDTVYVLNSGFYRSIDGGKTFTGLSTPHGDHHDLWIDPADPTRMIHGADGGAAISFDRGFSWSSIHNQATAEFYHVTTDTRFPYRVYGAQQDNSTITVQSRSHRLALGEREWYEVGGAESGYIQVRPDNPDIVYAGSSGGGHGGRLTRYDHRTHELRDISAWPQDTAGLASEEYTYRFQWTSPIVLSRHDLTTLYFCANQVFRTRDDGLTWDIVSPDLTKNDADKQRPSGGPLTKDHSGVEVYGTVFALAESPKQAGLLWAGTDDGLVHHSPDGGGHWTNVTPADLPEWALISIIEASPHDRDTAYLAATRYKLDDVAPYLYRTIDGGQSWTRITEGLPADEYTRTIREDPEVPGLLYCGTERGVYVSRTRGDSWEPLQSNLPLVPIHDLEVHDSDLVAATHGRSFWVLDDLSPVRAWALREGDSDSTCLYPVRDTVRTVQHAGFARRANAPVQDKPSVMMGFYLKERPATGEAPIFLDGGQNGPPGVLLHYRLPAGVDGMVEIRVRDSQGNTVATLSSQADSQQPRPQLPTGPGGHRVVWDMRTDGAVLPSYDKFEWPRLNPLVPPGRYQAELVVGGQVAGTEAFRLIPSPDIDTPDADYQAQFAMLVEIRDKVSAVHQAFNRLTQAASGVAALIKSAEAAGHADAARIRERGQSLVQRLDALSGQLVQTQIEHFQDTLNHGPRLNAQLAYLFRVASAADAAPTTPVRVRLDQLWTDAEPLLSQAETLVGQDLREFEALLDELKVPRVAVSR